MRRLVIGCGYVGHLAAQKWNENGDEVWALTRSSRRGEEFEAEGIQPLIGDITEPDSMPEFPDVDTLLFAVGMDRSAYSDVRMVYVDGLGNVLQSLKNVDRFIYISSTGVFGNGDGEWLDETSPTSPKRESSQACLEAEQLLAASPLSNRTVVLRLAGIYGEDRIPSLKFVSEGRTDKLKPEGYLNLIHREDAVTAIQLVASASQPDGLFLVSDGQPVWRGEYYDELAIRLGLPKIDWPDELGQPPRHSGSKRISNQKIVNELGMTFRYPSFRNGLDDLLPASSR